MQSFNYFSNKITRNSCKNFPHLTSFIRYYLFGEASKNYKLITLQFNDQVLQIIFY